MLNIIMLGLPWCLSLYAIQKRNLTKTIQIVLLFTSLVWFVAAGYILHAGVFLGSDEWWQRTPWKQMFMFVLMILGMLSSVLNAAIQERHADMRKLRENEKKRNFRLKIDRWDFVQPFLLSIITFGVLHSQIGNG